MLQRHVSCHRGSFSQNVLSHPRPGSQIHMATNVLPVSVEPDRSPTLSTLISISARLRHSHKVACKAPNLVGVPRHLPPDKRLNTKVQGNTKTRRQTLKATRQYVANDSVQMQVSGLIR